MARPQTGQVVERRFKHQRSYALRIPAYGERHYITLGSDNDGWTRKRAEEELANVMADVRRGIWLPPSPQRREELPIAETAATFHQFSSEWLEGRRGEISDAGHAHYEWALTYHLLPYFHNWALTDITVEAVDDYRRFKVRQSEQRRRPYEIARERGDAEKPPRPLAPSTINKTIDALHAILEVAVEYGHITTNPARGKRRRLKVPARRPVHLDCAEQIVAMLDAASELDTKAAGTNRRTPRADSHPPTRWPTCERSTGAALARRRSRERTHHGRPVEDSRGTP